MGVQRQKTRTTRRVMVDEDKFKWFLMYGSRFVSSSDEILDLEINYQNNNNEIVMVH